MQKIIKCKLNGKQSVTIPIHLKKNGMYIADDIDISVRGFLKFPTSTSSGTSTTEIDTTSEEAQQQAAYLLGNKSVVYPVIFTSNVVTAVGGKTTITLLPRAEDVISDYKTILGRINYSQTNVTNSDIISGINVSNDEQAEAGDKSSTNIIIETGVQRNPYYISIEITILDYTGKYYGQTVDRGAEETSTNDIFTHSKDVATSNLIINYYNDEDWIPTVTPILDTNDSDSGDILSEIDTLNDLIPFGASPIYDAIVEGAKILSTAPDNRKIVYLFTDNESNMSMSTLDEAIDYINNLDGEKQTPVIIGNFSTSEPATISASASATDTRDLNKISVETGGQSQTVFSEDQIEEITRIFYGKTVGSLGYGTYSFVIDLEEISLLNNIEADFSIFTNTTASWNIEYSDDNYTFTPIHNTYLPNEIVDLSDKNIYTRYIKINSTFVMGFGEDVYEESPSSPSLDTIIINYNKTKTTYLYLNKEDNDIPPYQIVVAVDSNNIESSQIEVGVAKSDAISWTDFVSSSQPSVNQNGKIIVPIRFTQDTSDFEKETLLKIDSFSLRAKNGQWDSKASVILYDKDDALVSSDSYKSFPRSGLIVLNSKLPLDYEDGDYKIGILNSSEYKIGLKITNKSPSNTVEIYGIGEMYTTGKELLPPIDKLPPEARNVTVSPEAATMFSPITFSYSFYDYNFDKEDTSKLRIKWYINDIYIKYLDNLEKWNDTEDDNDIIWTKSFTFSRSDLEDDETVIERARKNNESILKVGDKIYCIIQVSDGEMYSVATKSNIIQTLESPPLAYNLRIKAMKSDNSFIDRLSTDTAAVAKFDFFSDTGVNKSTIIWYANGAEFKRGTYGTTGADIIYPGEVSPTTLDIGLRMSNEFYFQVIPASATLNGTIATSDVAVVMNAYPSATDAKIMPANPTKLQNLVFSWTFFDFEIDILKDTTQEDMSTIKWYRKQAGQSAFAEVTDSTSLTQITTSLNNRNSTVSSSILSAGQQWRATITPNDSLDEGTIAESNTVTILAASS